ncbi:MAG: sigma-70 family RNA polymerase sigma factor [Polyangiales bacterium]
MRPPEQVRDWGALSATLRPFIARRVSSPGDADDVLQDTLLRLHRSAGDLRDEDRFGPWAYRVARSAIADHHRARGRHPLAAGEAPEEPDTPEEARVFNCAIEQHLGLLVEMLPEPYRDAVRATEIEGVSQTDLAARQGVSLSTVKSRVQRGRARLREMVETLCEVELDARGRLLRCDHRPGSPCCARHG